MSIAFVAAWCMVQPTGAAAPQDLLSGQPRPNGQLKIVRATYGVPGQTVDITTRIAPLVRGETLWMRVGAAETGPDPVPGAVKTLTVTYSYKGKTENASAKDRQSLAIGALPGPGGQRGALRFRLVDMIEETAVNLLRNVRVLNVFDGRVGTTTKNDWEQVNISSGAP